MEQFNEDLWEKLSELNDAPFKKKEHCCSYYWAEEKAELMPLPSTQYHYMERSTAKVSSDFHVRFDNAYYSVDKLDKLNREFSAIGNNLNQLTKYFNMGGLRSQAMTEELTRCINAIMDMRKEVKELGGEYRGYTQTHRK